MTALTKLSDGQARAVLPKPPDLWSQSHQHTLLSLFFVFSVAWALEQCVAVARVVLVPIDLILYSWIVLGEEYPTLKACVSFVPRG
jgi:hypothetical protein